VKKTLRQQIDELAAMDVAALQTRYLEFFGKEATCAHRQFLSRKIAWQVQAEDQGGLPESAIELARSIARDTPLRSHVLTNADRRRAGMPMDNSSTTTIEPEHDAHTPLLGGLIVKQSRGETHVVTVCEKGYQYGGSAFPSLGAGLPTPSGTRSFRWQTEF